MWFYTDIIVFIILIGEIKNKICPCIKTELCYGA